MRRIGLAVVLVLGIFLPSRSVDGQAAKVPRIGYLVLSPLADPPSAIRTPQWKTLMLPGGLGSTMKVLILAKGVDVRALRGTSFKVRVT